MISCNEYDAIEIVCMHHYPIKINTKNNEVIECIALDTRINSAREECIQVKLKDSANDLEQLKTQLIVLSDIVTLTVCRENPHFQVVTFK